MPADLSQITVPQLSSALDIPDLQKQLDDRGLKIKLTLNGFELVVVSEAPGQGVYHCPVKQSVVLSILSGNSSDALKVAVKTALIKVLVAIPELTKTETASFKEVAAMAVSSAAASATEAKATVTTAAAQASVATALKLPAVPLEIATNLYQLVTGTGSGSLYRVVAMGSGLKVAARLKGKTLSLRAEGMISMHLSALKAAELTPQVNNKYASVHLSVETEQLAARTLGAMLCDLGIQWDTPIPQLKYIKEGVN